MDKSKRIVCCILAVLISAAIYGWTLWYYQDYWFHIKGSLKGQVLGLPVALLVGGLTVLLAAIL